MGTVKEISARERLHHIIDVIDDDKVEAMLTLLHDVEEDGFELTDELKAELDKEYEDYLNGAKTYSKEEVFAHTQELLNSLKNKK